MSWPKPARFWSAPPAPRPIQLGPDSTEGRLIYAVGDIHGRRDLLQLVVRKIATDAIASGSVEQPMLVFLGDYIDRGPDSAGVISYILALKALEGFQVRCIKGNHEQTLLKFLDDSSIGPTWAEHGGGATLASYGIVAPTMRTDREGWETARLEFREALPASHLAFFQDLDLSITVGDYFFVHAGVRPRVSLAEQTEDDLLWSRNEFLAERRPFEKIIVHGHTPVESPFLGATRIGIDTGAYATGALSAIRLDGPQQSVVSTSGD